VVTKLTHNLTGYMMMQCMAEAFSVAVKAGVDPLDLWESWKLGVVGKHSPLQMLVKQFLPGTYENPAMRLELAHKDVTLATALGRELGVPLRMANMTLAEMTEAIARGMGGQDSRAYLKVQLERVGVEIAVDPERLRKALEASDRPV
jgi:3-hydroxyisobutyrate dehydrogenase